MGIGSMGFVVRAMSSSPYEAVQAHGQRVYEAQLLLYEARLELRECYHNKFVLGTDSCFMRIKSLEDILLQALEEEHLELEAKKQAAKDGEQLSAAVENSDRVSEGVTLSRLRLRDRGKDLAFSAATSHVESGFELPRPTRGPPSPPSTLRSRVEDSRSERARPPAPDNHAAETRAATLSSRARSSTPKSSTSCSSGRRSSGRRSSGSSTPKTCASPSTSKSSASPYAAKAACPSRFSLQPTGVKAPPKGVASAKDSLRLPRKQRVAPSDPCHETAQPTGAAALVKAEAPKAGTPRNSPRAGSPPASPTSVFSSLQKLAPRPLSSGHDTHTLTLPPVCRLLL